MLLWMIAGCVRETGGEQVAFSATLVNAADWDGGRWTDGSGWTVQLDTATACLGPVYLWSAEPTLDVEGWSALWSPLISTAHATADHFVAGFLRGQVTEQAPFDLLTEQTAPLGDGVGLAGTVRSAELWLEPPGEGCPYDTTIALSGTAQSGKTVVPFAAALTFDDDWIDASTGNYPERLRRMRGLLTDFTLAEGGSLLVEVDPTIWLDGADFAELLKTNPDDDGRYWITPDTQPGQVLYFRLREVGSTGPWAITWSNP
jgi:hypothetical protein